MNNFGEKVNSLRSIAELLRERFQREQDAWINTGVRDDKDGKIGEVGYEINFKGYFYRYQQPCPLVEIEVDIKSLKAKSWQC
jgi:type I restriction enzyme M protein